ncbi:hypothetical protein GX586_10305, partial [bacterium]|nr:hypothetical protein [bacterium]
MSEVIIGTSAHESADTALLRQAHIGWIRQGFGMPFADKVGGALSERYVKSKEQAQRWIAQGFKIMGVSHGIGIGTYVPDGAGGLKLQWKSSVPEWYGEPGSDRFIRTYRDVCAFLAADLRELVPLWQIANEFDIPQFFGPLDMAQAAKVLEEGARGLKQGNPHAIVGPNMGGILRGYYL